MARGGTSHPGDYNRGSVFQQPLTGGGPAPGGAGKKKKMGDYVALSGREEDKSHD